MQVLEHSGEDPLDPPRPFLHPLDAVCRRLWLGSPRSPSLRVVPQTCLDESKCLTHAITSGDMEPSAMNGPFCNASASRSPKGFRIIAKGWRALASLPWYVRKNPPLLLVEPQRGSASALHEPPPSIPNIPFIPRNAVFLQQGTELILKRFRPMMLRLVSHILNHRIRIRLAHRKCPVSGLPVKRRKLRPLLLHPHRAGAFQLFDPLRQRDRTIHPCQDMNMIRHTTNGDSRTLQGRRNAAQISVHGIHLLRVRKPRHPVPCRKHQMHDHVGQRLGHPTSFDISHSSQTQFHQADTEPHWGSALGGMGFAASFQGSGSAATLRYDAVSLWDTTALKPKGLPHHSEGLVSLSKPTLVRRPSQPQPSPGTPTGF